MNSLQNTFAQGVDLVSLNNIGKGSMVEFLSIKFIEVTNNQITASMPVNEKTKQPFGLLHGGASVVLAETLGSVASNIILNGKKIAAGIEINANHIKSAREGLVIGTAKAIHIGSKTHIWSIEIKDEKNNLICISRLTVAILEKKSRS